MGLKKGLLDQLLDKAAPLIEARIGELKEEATEEFDKINTKLDKIVALLEAR